MAIFLTTESGLFLTDEDGLFLTMDEVVLASVRRRFTVLPRTTKFKLIRDTDMALKISPRDKIDDMRVGEDYAFELDLTHELDTKTVSSYTYKIYDSNGDEVTDTFGGGSSIASGFITFGIKAVSAGKYTLKFVITCNELLPDESTQYEPIVEMNVTIS